MTITINEFVAREVIHCASYLVSDLYKLVNAVDYKVLRETSIDLDDLQYLMSREDWENPVEYYISKMSRDELIEALEEEDVVDERAVEDILNAENQTRAEAAARGEDLDEDESIPWAGIPDADLRIILFKHLESEDEIKEFAEEHNIDPEYDEVYEHWIVTGWLAEKLREKGEVVGEVDDFTVWGRCTTGQMISMDYVIQQIYKDLTGKEAEL